MAPIRRTALQASLEILFDLTPMELLIEQMGAASFMQTRLHLKQFADTPGGHLNIWGKKIEMLNIQRDNDTKTPIQR